MSTVEVRFVSREEAERYMPREHTFAGRPTRPSPPEREWWGTDTLPLHRGATRLDCRWLGVGDRVTATIPCPGDEQSGRMHGCRECEWMGRVSVFTATATEIVKVYGFAESLEGASIPLILRTIRGDGSALLLSAPKAKTVRTPLPGDWSTARHSIRFADVQPTEP